MEKFLADAKLDTALAAVLFEMDTGLSRFFITQLSIILNPFFAVRLQDDN